MTVSPSEDDAFLFASPGGSVLAAVVCIPARTAAGDKKYTKDLLWPWAGSLMLCEAAFANSTARHGFSHIAALR